MNTRARLFLVMVILLSLGLIELLRWVHGDVRPRLNATMEESMVDIANLLAALVSYQSDNDEIVIGGIDEALEAAQRRILNAQIYELNKRFVSLRVYVTDARGIVLFDSLGVSEGADFSKWNDVHRTLRGEYGARATRIEPENPYSSVLYVAAPIYLGDEIAGVLTVSKYTSNLSRYLEAITEKITWIGLAGVLLIIVFSAAVSYWIARPIDRLTAYAIAVSKGSRGPLPRLPRGETRRLGQAFEEMRTALEGKQYVEQYVQTLTHEMKSPLSAIRGTAELLSEEMPQEQRARFLENIRGEAKRLQTLVERMLELAAVESRTALHEVEPVSLDVLVRDVAASLEDVAAARGISIEITTDSPTTVQGDPFLLRQAIANLILNAIEFSPEHGKISIFLGEVDGVGSLRVEDLGPGIPEYAKEKIFERFYSLPRPHSGKKSSGLGLPLVREVAALHHGQLHIENWDGGGARATLRIPVA